MRHKFRVSSMFQLTSESYNNDFLSTKRSVFLLLSVSAIFNRVADSQLHT